MSTVLAYVPAAGHTRAHHPENSRRLAGVLPFLTQHGLLDYLDQLDERSASLGQVMRVHSRRYIQLVQSLSQSGGGNLNPDTYLTVETYDLAMQAAGGCLAVVDAVVDGTADNGLALVRPPGHHASVNQGEGFCLFNNIAIAARHAQEAHGLDRLLIIDFDVHHGNGTQDIFYADDQVLFISLHMLAPFFYPGSGRVGETGSGVGQGYTVNIPFPPGVGDQGYKRAFNELVVPLTREFRPEMILVSAGFDAHWRDPLAAARLTLAGYDQMARSLLNLSGELCSGRIIFVLEGGYFQEALQYGILNLVGALTGHQSFSDPLGSPPQPETDVTNLLQDLKHRHLLN